MATVQTEVKVIVDTIHWRNASVELPDAASEVLVCYKRNDCEERDVTIASFDDSREGSPWEVDGGLMSFGTVLYWADVPAGPQRSRAA